MIAQPASQNPFGAHENSVLVLQGGGALGAYQAGVFDAMHQCGISPNWVTGVSIGAINAALIAGNLPEHRLPRLKTFWDRVSERSTCLPETPYPSLRRTQNLMHAASTVLLGIPGFFQPHPLLPPFAFPGSPNAQSCYDTTPLIATLEELVDFDLINSGPVRLSLGAVNIRTGESVYFDNTRMTITPDHIRASGALPPSFPPVEIDGDFYWDGGILSNTPLNYLLDQGSNLSTIVYQVDLFNGAGELPQNLEEVRERSTDLQYASKRLFGINQFQRMVEHHIHLNQLLKKLPATLQSDPDVVKLRALAERKPLTLVHLINQTDTQSQSIKCTDFSHPTVTDLWTAGKNNFDILYANPSQFKRLELGSTLRVFDNMHDRAPEQGKSENR